MSRRQEGVITAENSLCGRGTRAGPLPHCPAGECRLCTLQRGAACPLLGFARVKSVRLSF